MIIDGKKEAELGDVEGQLKPYETAFESDLTLKQREEKKTLRENQDFQNKLRF